MLIRSFFCYFAKNRFYTDDFPTILKSLFAPKKSICSGVTFQYSCEWYIQQINCLKCLNLCDFQTSLKKYMKCFFLEACRFEIVIVLLIIDLSQASFRAISEHSHKTFFLEPVFVEVRISGLQTFNIREKGFLLNIFFFLNICSAVFIKELHDICFSGCFLKFCCSYFKALS